MQYVIGVMFFSLLLSSCNENHAPVERDGFYAASAAEGGSGGQQQASSLQASADLPLTSLVPGAKVCFGTAFSLAGPTLTIVNSNVVKNPVQIQAGAYYQEVSGNQVQNLAARVEQSDSSFNFNQAPVAHFYATSDMKASDCQVIESVSRDGTSGEITLQFTHSSPPVASAYTDEEKLLVDGPDTCGALTALLGGDGAIFIR